MSKAADARKTARSRGKACRASGRADGAGGGGLMSRSTKDDEEHRAIGEHFFRLVEPRWPGSPAVFPSWAEAEASLDCVLPALESAERWSRIEPPLAGWEVEVEFAVQSLIDVLVARAAAGEVIAQTVVFDLARLLSGWVVSGIREDWPGMLSRARHSVEVPGLVSLDPKVDEVNQRELSRILQGSETPMARKPRSKGTDSSLPQVRVVCVLHDYIAGVRRHKGFCREEVARFVHPLVLRMHALEEFGSSTWKDWRKVGWDILREFSPNRDPVAHPAFNRPPLGAINNANASGKNQLARKLGDAWEKLSSAKGSEMPRE